MQEITIRGPFRNSGINVEMYPIQGVDDQGRVYRKMPFAIATQLFLDVFNPDKGWSVTVESAVMDMDMRTLADRENDVGHKYPPLKIVASLGNPQGVIIGSASTVWVMSGATELEKGETNARLRLYAAMGLPTVHYDNDQVDGILPGAGQQARSPLDGVRPRESSLPKHHQSASTTAAAPAADEPAPAQSTTDTTVEAETAVSASTSDTDASPIGETTAKSGKRQRASPDDPPNASLLATIANQCRVRNIEVPELKTVRAARAFLDELNGKPSAGDRKSVV